MSTSSSFCSESHGWTYHTFVSFRGQDEHEDLRHKFIGNLRHSFVQRGIRVFMDDEIRKGDHITDTLLKSIKESQTAILVFSKYYATSSFCLRELVHIQNCIKGPRRPIWAVFYDVDPSDVRHQKNTYEISFQRYDNEKKENGERKYDEDEVNEWRSALSKAADICGWHWETSSQTYEYAIIEEIIEAVSKVTNDDPLFIAQYPVGLNSGVQDVLELLQKEPNVDGATMVGICGTGGIGKSTLARAVYNEIAKDFKHLCFLANVREQPIPKIAKKLLSKTIWEKDYALDNVDECTIPLIIKDRLQSKKVLIVLDDIDELKQLQALAGESSWFGDGSKIIITTRDSGLLLKHNVKIYKVKLLEDDKASELMRLQAFGKNKVDPKYEDVINRAVKYADGLPLVLEVLGSHLSVHQTPEDWEGILDKYERIPNKTILQTLKVSYDALEEIHQQIFLDIACFYRGKSLEYVTYIMGISHDFSHPESYIRVLIERSLLKVDEDSSVQMHDLIQDMAHEIVRQESTEPGKRSRLFSSKDILHVLKTNTGTGSIQAINFFFSTEIEVNWRGKAFKKMTCLRELTIDGYAFFREGPQYLPDSLRILDWTYYPSLTLPDHFDPCNLAILSLYYSNIQTLPSTNLPSLRKLDLHHCPNLKEIPDMSRAANLEILKVQGCKNLTKIDDSVGHLSRLKELDASVCCSLETFIKGGIKLPSLKILSLNGCSKLEKFPQILAEMENMRELDLFQSGIKELPESIENLVGLEILNVSCCTNLRKSPISSILKLEKLMKFYASTCRSLPTWFRSHSVNLERRYFSITELDLSGNVFGKKVVVKILSFFPNLISLSLCWSNLTKLPKCIEKCHNLKTLNLTRCWYLRKISGIPPKLHEFSAKCCPNLTPHSRRLLLSQALHESGGTEFSLPGTEIPEWFHKQNGGDSVTFWFRKRFPHIALCVVFQAESDCHDTVDYEFQILVNRSYRIEWKSYDFELQSDSVYLFDLDEQGSKFGLKSEVFNEGWNHVLIKCDAKTFSSSEYCVKCIGLYAYNYEKCKADIDWNNAGPST